MTWWEIAPTVWIFGSFPFALLIGKAIAHGHQPIVVHEKRVATVTADLSRAR